MMLRMLAVCIFFPLSVKSVYISQLSIQSPVSPSQFYPVGNSPTYSHSLLTPEQLCEALKGRNAQFNDTYHLHVAPYSLCVFLEWGAGWLYRNPFFFLYCWAVFSVLCPIQLQCVSAVKLLFHLWDVLAFWCGMSPCYKLCLMKCFNLL